MPGYFDDGTRHVDLGYHVFATPSAYRRNVRREPHASVASVMSSGGGVLELAVTGQRDRANLGDAERWLYERLRALAFTGPGELGCEDHLGNRATFAQCVCTGAAGEVHAFRFAELQAEFLCPEASSAPAWGSVPAAPGFYAGSVWEQQYEAGGVALGHHAEGLRMEMQRGWPLREIPRARGARSRGPVSGCSPGGRSPPCTSTAGVSTTAPPTARMSGRRRTWRGVAGSDTRAGATRGQRGVS